MSEISSDPGAICTGGGIVELLMVRPSQPLQNARHEFTGLAAGQAGDALDGVIDQTLAESVFRST